MFEHLDEHGEPCTRHVANRDALLTFAAIGARVSSFNHDLASKLQGVMMAIDEISELASDANTRRAVETAQEALQEATALLATNRALTRAAIPAKIALRDLVAAAGDRVGVKVRGALPDGELVCVVPLTTHGLGLALDAIAGAGRARAVDLVASQADGRVTLELASTAEPAKSANDSLALAAFVIARAGGEVRCRERGLIVQLPAS